jgi:hypothetical protein
MFVCVLNYQNQFKLCFESFNTSNYFDEKKSASKGSRILTRRSYLLWQSLSETTDNKTVDEYRVIKELIC